MFMFQKHMQILKHMQIYVRNMNFLFSFNYDINKRDT